MSILPKKPTPPKRDLSEVSALIYGPSKIGKSTLASNFPSALFIATEPGLNALNVFQVDVADWEAFLTVCKEIAKGDHEFKTIVIDTIDVLYSLASKAICDREGFKHPGDAGHGKLYGMIKNEILRVLQKLAALPYGLVLISHSKEKEIKTRTGAITRAQPTLSDSFAEVVLGLVDLILFVDMIDEPAEDGSVITHRIIRTKPSTTFAAGDRFNVLPPVLPLEYAALKKAFENGAKPSGTRPADQSKSAKTETKAAGVKPADPKK